MTDLGKTYHHTDLSIDQQLALRTAPVNLGRHSDDLERRVHALLGQLGVPATGAA